MKIILEIAIILAIAIGANMLLNSGCPSNKVGVVTWHGIECF